jgi:hypothetical protein
VGRWAAGAEAPCDRHLAGSGMEKQEYSGGCVQAGQEQETPLAPSSINGHRSRLSMNMVHHSSIAPNRSKPQVIQ